MIESHILVRLHKLVRTWKRLQHSGFPERDGTILFRMAEPAVAIPKALCGDCGSDLIPLHTSIDAWICHPAAFLVAGSAQLKIPIAPRTARLGCLYALHVQ